MTVRTLNIALRTVHIVVMGVLLGGHAFEATRAQLLPWLWATIGSGVALAAVEAGPRLVWFHQGRGLLTLFKLVLLCIVPLAWDYRLPILFVVVALGSVGSHMPARYRYYSMVYGQVIPDTSGPSGKHVAEDAANKSE